MRLTFLTLLSILLFACNPEATNPGQTATGRPLAAPAPAPTPPMVKRNPNDQTELEAVEVTEEMQSVRAEDRSMVGHEEDTEPRPNNRIQDPQAEKEEFMREMKRRRAAEAARLRENETVRPATTNDAGQRTNDVRNGVSTVRDAAADATLPSAMSLERTTPYFEVRTSGCYGECPQYRFRLLPDNLAYLEGKRHVEKLGTHVLPLSYEQAVELTKLYNEVAPIQLAALYPTDEEPPADIPATTYVYTDTEGETREVTVYYAAPRELEVLFERVEELVKTGDWVPVK